MRRPFSLIFFLLTGIGFLLQVVPTVGIFLMFLLAPFWSVLLINAGFVGIGVEALIGRVSRLWLLLPLLWFGGYAVFAARDHLAVAALRAEIAAANEGAPIPFDPATMSLLVTRPQSGMGGTPSELVAHYRIATVYELQGDGTATRTFAHRLAARTDCDRVREANVDGADVRTFGFREGDEILARRLVTDFCLLAMPEAPPHPALQVASREVSGTERGMEVTRELIAIRAPDGRARTLTAGRASPLRWIPMPVIGCFYDGSGWRCDAVFFRSGFTSLVPADRYGGATGLIAGALGLRRMPPEARSATPSPELRARLERAEADALAGERAQLEWVLREPLAQIDSVPFRLIRNRPEALAPYAVRLTPAIEAAAEEGLPARDNGRNLAILAAALPPAHFASEGPRLLALYRRYPDDEHWMNETDELLMRIGDLGMEALPLLLTALDRRRSGSLEAAAAGICKIGRPAAAEAGPALLRHWTRARNRGRDMTDWGDQRIYAALLRLGLRNQAGPVEQRYQGPWFREAWATITPASPAQVCLATSRPRPRNRRD